MSSLIAPGTRFFVGSDVIYSGLTATTIRSRIL